MSCNINVICFIDQYSEMPGKSNFVVNAVGIINPQYKSDNVYVQIVFFIQLITPEIIILLRELKS